MGRITFRYWEPREEALLPELFAILYENMSALAPTGYSYREDYDIWQGYILPALKAPDRKLLLMYVEDTLAGYFQYSIEGDTVFVEEVEIRPAWQRSMVFYRCCQFLAEEIPEGVSWICSYVNKKNRHSLSIHEKLGMERIGENKSGNSWCCRGEIRKAAARFRKRGG